MPITKEQAIAELERRKNPTSTSIPISKESAIAELQRRRMSGTQKEPTLLSKGISAGKKILDNPVVQTVLGAINPTASLMTSTQPARKFTGNAVSSALFNIPKVVPEIREALRPNNMSEGIAAGAGQLAGAVIPFGAPTKLVGAVERGITSKAGKKVLAKAMGYSNSIAKKSLLKGINNFAKGLGYAGAGATMGAVETPEDTSKFFDIKQRGQQAAVGGALGLALPATIGGVSGAVRVAGSVTKRLPTKIINEIISPRSSDLKYGKNPARTFLKRKIVSNDIIGLDDFEAVTLKEKNLVGKQLDTEYSKMTGSFDIDNAVKKPAYDALAKLNKYPESNANAIARIEKYLKDIDNIKTKNLSPKETWNQMKEIGDLANWVGDVKADTESNQVIQNAYRNITAKLQRANPKLRELNQAYGDLLTGAKAIEKRKVVVEKRNIVDLGSIISGIGATAATGGNVGIGLATGLGYKSMQLPALKTRLAQTLNSKPIQWIADKMSKSPKFTDLFNSVYGVSAKNPQEIKAVVAEIVPEGTGFSRGNMTQQTQKALPAPEYQYLYGSGGTVRNIKPSDIGSRNIASFTPDEWKAQLGNRYTPEQMRQHVLRGKREIVDRIKNGKPFDQSWIKNYPDIKRIAEKYKEKIK